MCVSPGSQLLWPYSPTQRWPWRAIGKENLSLGRTCQCCLKIKMFRGPAQHNSLVMVYGHRIIWMVRGLEGKRLEDSCQEGLGRGMRIELLQWAHNMSLCVTHIFIQKRACSEEKLLENEWDTLTCFVEICKPLSPVWQIVSSWLGPGCAFLAGRPHN